MDISTKINELLKNNGLDYDLCLNESYYPNGNNGNLEVCEESDHASYHLQFAIAVDKTAFDNCIQALELFLQSFKCEIEYFKSNKIGLIYSLDCRFIVAV